jgi:hypothetical protein
MTGVKFLEELLTEENISERFGLKTEGLVKLKKVLEHPEMPKPPSYVKIPNMFAIETGTDWNNTELRQAYNTLTSGFNKLRIIFARSSDPQETPGKFETASSLYIPGNPEQSFKNWINAAKRVRESGARAIIGQPMIGEIRSFPNEFDSDTGRYKEILVFGSKITSFFMNSSNWIRGDLPVIIAGNGLGSKIARGDMDVCMIERNISKYEVINLNHNYSAESFSHYNPETIDLITLENPNKISTLEIMSEYKPTRKPWGRSWIPFDDYNFMFKYNHSMGREGDTFSPTELFYTLQCVKWSTDKHVEIEGCADDDGIHLLQLREYETPKKNFHKLTKINPEKKILDIEMWGIGFNQFKGDLFISDKIIDVPKDAIFFYDKGRNNYIDAQNLQKYKQLVIPYHGHQGEYFEHQLGETIQTMVELEKLGVKSIALHGIEHNIITALKIKESLYKKENNAIVFHNVTVECDGHEAQIYFND